MDTIIWLISNHQVYVGDFYKGVLKEVPFEKTDTWEVYGVDDLEKLVDYMNYPLHYKQFKNSNLIILFDEIKIYEMLSKIQRCFKHCNGVALKRIEPFLVQVALKEGIGTGQKVEFADKYYELIKEKGCTLLKECLEEEEDGQDLENGVIKPMTIYEYLIDLLETESLVVENLEDIFKYDLILSQTTLYTQGGQKEKRYLQVEDVILADTIVADGALVDKGEEIFRYSHSVQKMFGRIKAEEIVKQASREGKVHFVKELDTSKQIWTIKDEVVGLIGERTSSKIDALTWYKKNIIF